MLVQGIKQVLVKMGENGSVLVCNNQLPVYQPAILYPVLVDTAGASDAFTAAYAVALIERQTPAEALRFAGKSSAFVLHHFVWLVNVECFSRNSSNYFTK